MLTTAAQRGIALIFGGIILLNYLIHIRRVPMLSWLSTIVIPAVAVIALNQLFDFRLDKNIKVAQVRFEGTVSGEKRYFGLDESLFQRLGETLDIGSQFVHQPLYLLSGFGNGAMLVNKLMTPSEHWIYRTNIKHNIYSTPVALIYRNGILGLVLYFLIFLYVANVLNHLRRTRTLLSRRPEFVYLKVLCFYQLSIMAMSVIAYWYVGNIIVAFTISLIEIFRKELPQLPAKEKLYVTR
jgi:hypothetical protein